MNWKKAAAYNTAIRINRHTAEYSYVSAINDYLCQHHAATPLETTIAYPGLPTPQNQLAVPISDGDHVLGVVYVESEEQHCFDFNDEDAVVCLATTTAQMIRTLQNGPIANGGSSPSERAPDSPICAAQAPLTVRYYPQTHSVFINHDYLIKGVAGAILWRLLQRYQAEQRQRFTNRELRLDKTLKLPEVDDNLETRLILLRKRLAERTDCIAIVPAGRGCFDLRVSQNIDLLTVNSAD